MTWIVATLYKFVHLPDYVEIQPRLLAHCKSEGVKGTLLLAQEGINGAIAGTRAGIDSVLAWLKQDPRLSDLQPKESIAEQPPFERMKVRLKKEIVTMGLPEVDPNSQVGVYVSPEDWNRIISDPEVVVIDARNQYEIDIGTFQSAQNPNIQSFRQFPDYVRKTLDPTKHKKVALFCTGGIRCEKASSFMLTEGFEAVYHLKGGILKYLEEIPEADSLWQGECFVFDQRVAVRHRLEPGTYNLCHSCGHPISEADKISPHYEAGISCPHCFHILTPEKRLRQEERRRQLEKAQLGD
ncbi:MAG: rhodanese-related sulfurtransferase [Leptolyngbyaceae cyanobacterium MO_188.B28]|nr:rhodanese-related sulfurtransferase [Leptolyngbyaceae cyanobacterium MO_188.B28]